MDDIRKTDLFENKNVTRAVVEMALPTAMGQIILVVYNMADTFFIGLTGRDSMIAAVTVCMPAFMFLSAISNLFGIGGASVIARALGSENEGLVRRASAFAFWGCLSVAAAYSAFAFFAKDAYIDLLGGTNPSVHPHSVEYLLCTVVAGGCVTATVTLLSHLIRAEGRAFYASAGIALGGVLNIALDPLFMFVILPKGREALGAALATVLSNVASLVYFAAVIVVSRRRGRSMLRFVPSGAMFAEDVPRDVFQAGIPACIMTLFENISYAVLDKLMSLEGLSMQAGIGVAKKVNMLAHNAVRGIAQGALPLIAYNYAAKNYRRMNDSLRVAVILAVLTASAAAAACLLLSRELIGLFILGDTPSLSFGAAFLRILCVGGPFSAAAYTCISFFQAVGDGKRAFAIAVLRKGFLDIPLMFMLGAVFPIYGIVAATPIADAFASLVAAVLFFRHAARLKKNSAAR